MAYHLSFGIFSRRSGYMQLNEIKYFSKGCGWLRYMYSKHLLIENIKASLLSLYNLWCAVSQAQLCHDRRSVLFASCTTCMCNLAEQYSALEHTYPSAFTLGCLKLQSFENKVLNANFNMQISWTISDFSKFKCEKDSIGGFSGMIFYVNVNRKRLYVDFVLITWTYSLLLATFQVGYYFYPEKFYSCVFELRRSWTWVQFYN